MFYAVQNAHAQGHGRDEQDIGEADADQMSREPEHLRPLGGKSRSDEHGHGLGKKNYQQGQTAEDDQQPEQ